MKTTHSLARRQRCGFTLVELLVVIAIIGVLIGMLLPAVQSAREAGRRITCGNNIRQLGLALQLHHDGKKKFPMGTASSKFPLYNTTAVNWRVRVFPYLDLSTVYDRLEFDTGNGFSSSAWGMWTAPNNVLEGLLVPQMRCPSNPTDAFTPDESHAMNSFNGKTFNADYVGVAGAYPDPGGRGSAVCRQSYNGYTCNTGLLVPHEFRTLAAASDGTTHTIIVAEQSGLVGGKPRRSNYVGAWCGGRDDWCGYDLNPRPANKIEDNGQCSYHHNGLTIVRFQINSPSYMARASEWAEQTNTILNSSHAGMILVVMGDGSVRTLQETIDMEALRRLSCGDDGQLVNDGT